MVSINYATREVTCKIVYYGPGLSGKTTNLLYIHEKIPSNTKGKMISLATEADRTLYFDFLPINIGTISGFAAKFQLYTVPGQVYYNATRKLVLRGADGLVFVADSQADKMDENIESLNNMKENLAEYGYDINEMPIVIQYNKRDLPNILPVEELEAKLNTYGWRSFTGEAVNGNGVFDTLKMIIKLVLDKARSSQTTVKEARLERQVEKPAGAEKRAQAAGGVSSQHSESPQARTDTAPQKPSPTPAEQPSREAAYDAESMQDEEQYSSEKSPDSSLYEHNVLKDEPETDNDKSKPPSEIPPESSEEPDEEPEQELKPPEPEPEPVSRPFPGSSGKVPQRARKISVSDFQGGSSEDDEDTHVENNASDEDTGHHTERNDGMATPKMAPSNRVIKKKRGFFKRLFGMK